MPARTAADPAYGADVISLNEAACRLGIHPRTYVDGMERGELPGTKWNKTVVIPRTAYQLFLTLGRMPRYEDMEDAA